MKSYRERSGRMFEDFEQDEVERAYKRGCEHGYRKAMEEMGGGNFGRRSWTISEGNGMFGRRERENYGMRNDDDMEGSDYSERRYRDSMGRFR